MNEDRKPFAYISSKAGRWTGYCAPDIAADWLVKMAAAGCLIHPVYSREEYDTEMAKLD